MRFLEADKVVLVGKPFELLLLCSPETERRLWSQEVRSYSTIHNEGHLRECGHMNPFLGEAGVFQVLVEHRVANVHVEVQEARNLGYYRRHLHAMVRGLLAPVLQVGSTAAKELGARRPSRRRAERGNSAAYSIRYTGAFNLYQNGLTSSQPDGGAKVASRSVVWSVKLGLNGFPVMTLKIVQASASATRRGHCKKKGEAPRLGKRRNGDEANGLPSHIGLAVLGRSTCFTDNLLQNVTGMPGTDTQGELQYQCSAEIGANLKTGFPIPFLRSYTLRTCVRKSMNGTT